MFYSGNPKNPTEYNPARNTGDTNDPNTLRPIETSEIFTQSVPSGDRTINGILVNIVSGERLNITGPSPSYIYGPINTNLILAGGAQFPDGSPGNPSITFINDPDTGIYRGGDGAVSFTSNSNPTVAIGPNLNTSVPITTPPGNNLILNPGGPAIDCTNHFLINVAGITQDPNYVSIVGATVITPDTTPLTGLTIPTDANYAYAIEVNIAFANASDGTSSGGIFINTKGKNIGGVASAVIPYIHLNRYLDPSLIGCKAEFAILGSNIVVVVTGLGATNIKWRAVATVTRQSF
jgi:hypothetical protein